MTCRGSYAESNKKIAVKVRIPEYTFERQAQSLSFFQPGAWRQRQAILLELESNMIYIVSFRTFGTTGMVAHACNLNPGEEETGGSMGFPGLPT